MRFGSFFTALCFMGAAAIGWDIEAIKAGSALMLCGIALAWLIDGVCHAIRESKR